MNGKREKFNRKGTKTDGKRWIVVGMEIREERVTKGEKRAKFNENE